MDYFGQENGMNRAESFVDRDSGQGKGTQYLFSPCVKLSDNCKG